MQQSSRRPGPISLGAGLLFFCFAAAGPALAQETPAPQLVPSVPPPAVYETRSATWPLSLGLAPLIGVEPHDRGNPVAFGVMGELLWKAQLGGFVALLASEGTPIIAPRIGDVQQPSFGDRISVPFGFAARPLAKLGLRRRDYLGRFLTGIDLQAGLTIEHVRTSDDSATTAGLHLGLGLDVPLWGGTREGGVALRIYGRVLVTPSITLDLQQSTTPANQQNATYVLEPVASAQIFAGVAYYP